MEAGLKVFVLIFCCHGVLSQVLNLGGLSLGGGTAFAGHEDVGLTMSQVKELLDLHNAKKREPTVDGTQAANMKAYIWDEELAIIAKRLADKCDFSHQWDKSATSYDGVGLGQNLAASKNIASPHVHGFNSWFNELTNDGYSYAVNTCQGVCGHYTQVVWAGSSRVGCAKSFCNTLQGVSWGDADYTVCNYYTPGNFRGQKPYIQGSPCSACEEGACSADGKLCVTPEAEDCFEKCGNEGFCSRRCIDGNCNNIQCLCEGGSSDCAENAVRVDKIEPNRGGTNGATRMTIHGKGFGVADIFNYSNTVEFVTESLTYECLIDKDGSDEDQIMCETVAMPADDYYVRVTINGLVIPDERLCNGNPFGSNCKLRIKSSHTPTIDMLKTFAVPQGSLIEMEGVIFTDRYGSNLDASSNGRLEKLKRVYAGKNCELVNETSQELYGLALTSGDYGRITCQLQGKFIGHINTSIIVEGEFGRSKPDIDTLRVSSTNKIFMLQTYAEVTDVSPSIGSPAGGTRITINGTNFDNSSIPARVEVGGVPCEVLYVDDNSIVCGTPEKQPTRLGYPGGRGALYEQWSGKHIASFNDLAAVGDLTEADAGYSSYPIDPMAFIDLGEDNFASRTTAYFVPPRTAQYRFYIRSDDMSALYMSPDDDPSNKVQIAYSESYSPSYTSKGSQQKSDKMDLEAGKRYYLEALQQDWGGGEGMSVAVKMYAGEYTDKQTFQAIHEQQHIDLISIVQPEIQTISLQNWATQSAVGEVQTITFDFADNVISGNFRLGFLGVFSDHLATDSSVSDIQKALNKLPTIYPDTVSVSAAIGGGFTVAFNSDKGDLPLLEYKDNTVNVTVTEDTKGVPSLDNYYLTFEEVVSGAISKTATAEEIKQAIEAMFSIVCPQEVLTVANNVLQVDYEDPSHPAIISGSVVQDAEPFCGRSSLKNPWNIYRSDGVLSPEINPDEHKYFCFAYRGFIRGISFFVTYYTDELKDTWGWVPIVPSESWVYQCAKLRDRFNVADDAWNIRVTKFYAYSQDSKDFYLDTMSISKELPTNDEAGVVIKRRLPPRVDRFQMGQISVDGDSSSYNVTLSPNNCESDFPLFGVFGAMNTSGSLESDAASLSGDDWPSNVAVSVSRQQRASPPVLGTFSLTYKDTVLTNIPIDSDAEYLQTLLQTAERIGQVSVSRSGLCSDYSWKIDWISAGNQPELEVDYSGVSGHNATLEMRTSRNGGTFFDPIPGDMLRTVESLPQVVVYINNLPSACVGNCSFTWSDSVLPTISGVSPSSGSDNTVITISGNNFNSDKDLNEVTIGGTPCAISTASPTEIKCTVGEGTAGSHLVKVNNLEMGFANHTNGDVMFTYAWEITGISPSVGSVGGCTLLTVNGTGFAANSTVTLGDSPCEITSLAYNQLQCVTPPNLPGDYQVAMSFDGESTSSPTNFTYDASSTPNVTSISTDVALVIGGTTLDITGEGFGAQALSDSAVTLGGVPAAIVHYNDTHIQVELPSLAPGVYPLKIEVQGAGCADLVQNNISQISYKLKVTGMSPNYGSQFGGTVVSLHGEGFSLDKDDNMVSIGDSDCEVQSASDSLLTCVTRVTGKTHVVVNKVSENLATWEPPSLTIKAGDTVRWSWTTPPSISGLAYGIQETEEAGSKIGKVGGFASPGAKTANGAFEYMFTSPGTYFYWSNGAIDNVGAWILRGAVRVLPKENQAKYVRVSINGHEAEYDTSQNASISSNANASCPNADTPRAGCSAPVPSQNNSNGDMFEFAFWDCSTAQVTDISQNVVTSADEIVFSGMGFSSELCENEVTVGDYICNVTSANETMVACKIDANGTMPVGMPIRYEVTVHNRGLALNMLKTDLDRHIILTPRIDSISPQTGSTAGGTLITITGDGFDGDANDITVTVGSYVQCAVTQVSYSEVVCRTQAYTDYVGNVSLTLSAYGNDLVAECDDLMCEFNMSSEFTPLLTSVTPSVVSGDNTPLTITGDNFGSDPNAIEVVLGDTQCAVDSVGDSEIICNMSFVDVGRQDFYVHVKGAGNAKGSINALVSNATIDSVVPSKGSIHGGQEITITGNGFKQNSIQVTVNDVACAVKSSTPSTIICKTPSKAGEVRYKRDVGDENVAVVVISNGIEYPSLQYSYEGDSTPQITSINPTTGVSGDQLVISGKNFNSTPTVTIDNVECNVTAFSYDEITCIVGDHAAGNYPVMIDVDGFGLGGGEVEFSYLLEVTDSSPDTGSFGGGQLITITGQGFDNKTAWVTVCNKTCSLVTGTPTEIVCEVPGNQDGYSNGGTVTCDVRIKVNNAMETLADEYTYDGSLTPAITSISPTSGGTGGGTMLTINGNGFGDNVEDNEVTIAGTACNITQASSSEIICITGAHSPTVRANVRVQVSGQGSALQNNAEFFYIDRWSSKFTWGGGPLPTDGDMVVIDEGQTILMDVNVTPVFRLVLIKGGALIFDDTMDVHFQSQVILIVNGGRLQVGTEEEPFQHEAIITLHGHLRSKELPIYGTKNIAVRGGTLDLHGIPKIMTWTRLDETAAAGSTTLKLEQPVDWKVGDEIIIATTGYRHSQRESEQRTITDISNDNLTLTIDRALEYEHLGETLYFDSNTVKLEMKGEVGLLTRNVKIKGSRDLQWADEIEACPDGFNTGEFATQTCFQGRFGDEIGSDQFGGHIIMHPPRKNENLVIGRISYVEFNYVGQAFRLGRYPIHFHLLGDVNFTSYVRGCALHETFNRAVNIHGTHHVLIEHNVIYNVMGGAFFLEDGIETGNIIQYNLAVFVKQSTSLLNDDITPSAFWVTNPNNTIRHNTGVGGTHFAFWYRMHTHPDGPSFTSSVCPKKVPLGEFFNNTGHSLGWFGIWIFQEMFPVEGGSCGGSTPVAANFDTLIAWHCEKGAEWVNGGALHFNNFIMAENEKAGMEMKRIMNARDFDGSQGAMVNNSVLIGYARENAPTTRHGIILPLDRGLLTYNTKFINFNGNSACLGICTIDGKCIKNCGGFEYRFKNIAFINAEDNKARFKHEHEAIFVDEDGSFTGSAGAVVTPYNPSLPSSCTKDESWSKGVDGAVCPSGTIFRRFSFNQASPRSLWFKNVMLTSPTGTSVVPFEPKRMTHKMGWMLTMVSGIQYNMIFQHVDHVTNFSYTGTYYDFAEDEYIIVTHNLTQKPDRFKILSSEQKADEGEPVALSYELNDNGDWFFDTNSKTVSYIITGKGQRKKRSVEPSRRSSNVNFRVYRCYYQDCLPPPDPNSIPPARERPAVYQKWSENGHWSSNQWSDGFGNSFYETTIGSNRRKRQVGNLPPDGSNIKVSGDTWLVADTALPKMNRLYIYGVLELDGDANPDGSYKDFTIEATYIFIQGGRLIIGWPDQAFLGTATIILHGHHHTPDMPLPGGPNMGAKVIGAFGGLDLHGKDHSYTWTKLSSTANVGDNSITVADPVDWEVGDDIVVITTDLSSRHSEIFKITSISDKTLGLNATMQYKHIAVTESLSNGQSYEMAAEVGLLTRNIKIIGGDYAELADELFGSRVIIGRFVQGGTIYRGYARVSNVEFYRGGQEGWVDSYDPRFAIAWVSAGTSDSLKPSEIKKCSFHGGYNSAIGVFGTNGVVVKDNVIHYTIGAGIKVDGTNISIEHNLVSAAMWLGSLPGRSESANFDHHGGIEVNQASSVLLKNNHVGGVERIAFRIGGEPCDGEPNNVEAWSGNVAHSALSGVTMLPDVPDCVGTCVKISGFMVYKTRDWGIYYQSECSVEAQDLILVDNKVSFFSLVIKPAAASHATSDKYTNLKNSLIVGQSSEFDCNDNINDELNFQLSSKARSFGGASGIVMSGFYSSSNKAPFKPWKGIMSYNAISGITRVQDVTLANFGTWCGSRSFAFIDNPGNADGLHPVETERLTLIDVEKDSTAFIHRSNVGKVNPADCVDMECDAQKKAMFKDLDGTLLGSIGAVIPDSAYEWNGDRRRGLGDYRIPKTMLTTIEGVRLDVNVVMPYKGIIGTGDSSKCTFIDAWQAYECHGLNYEMMIIESLDSDTETRRLSPVGIWGDKTIDLINGPQDHGWCNGYTCQKRLSTFMSLVATGKEYELHYTSTSPQSSRFILLNSGESEAVKMAVWYSNPQRLAVYVDGVYIVPLNVEENEEGKEIFKGPTYEGQYMPNVTGSNGDNFFDRDTGLLHFLVRGTAPIVIRTLPVIMVAFNMPALTVDEFFGENIVNNLALFLDIPPEKIRIVNIVSEQSGRRKRAVSGIMKVEVEIGNKPSNDNSSIVVANANVSNPISIAPGDLDFAKLENATSKIIDAVQLGSLSDVLNVTVLSVAVIEPVPDSSAPEWGEVANKSDVSVTIKVPTSLQLMSQILGTTEGSELPTQPVLYMYDQDGDLVTQLGSSSNPWEVTASIRANSGSDSRAVIEGLTTVKFEEGIATFTNLSISHSGSGYIIDFIVTKPAEAAGFKASSPALTITEAPLKLALITTPSSAYSGQTTSVTVEVQNADTGIALPDLEWKGNTWSATVSLYPSNSNFGTLYGTKTMSFNGSRLVFDNLMLVHNLTQPKSVFLKVATTTVPSDNRYSLTAITQVIDVYPMNYSAPVAEKNSTVQLTFNADYDSIASGSEKYLSAHIKNHFQQKYPDVLIGIPTLAKGSILATFYVVGPMEKWNSTLIGIYEDLKSGLTLTFNGQSLPADTSMVVDSEAYYGLDGPPTVPIEADTGLGLGIIIVIAVVPTLVIIAVIVIVIVKIKMASGKVVPSPESTPTSSAHAGRRRSYVYTAPEPIPCKAPTSTSWADKVDDPDVRGVTSLQMETIQDEY